MLQRVPSDFYHTEILFYKNFIFLTNYKDPYFRYVLKIERKRYFIVTLNKCGNLFGEYNLVNPD